MKNRIRDGVGSLFGKSLAFVGIAAAFASGGYAGGNGCRAGATPTLSAAEADIAAEGRNYGIIRRK